MPRKRTDDESADEPEPSPSIPEARELRDLLAAERGVDLAAAAAAARSLEEQRPVTDDDALPYASEDEDLPRKRRTLLWAGVATAVAVAAASIALVVSASNDDETATAPSFVAAAGTTVPPATIPPNPTTPVTTTPPVASTAPPTTAAPAPTTPAGGTVPAVRGARYRDGKLYLEGAVPSQEIADAFIEKASEVIGPDNVINNYVIDPSAPVPTDGRVIVDDPVLFATGSAEINPQFYDLLDLGIVVMQLNPEVVMRLEGHTDSVGTTENNQRLSQRRAQAAADYIIAGGIAAGRFEVIGLGETDPIASNVTPEGRQQNRRIEAELLGLLAPDL